jgi:site-specific DNA recombinase
MAAAARNAAFSGRFSRFSSRRWAAAQAGFSRSCSGGVGLRGGGPGSGCGVAYWYPTKSRSVLSGMPSKTVSVLGAARLSKDADESTSIERQSSGISGSAKLRSTTTGDDYQVVQISEDSDVSGAVSPFDRAGLGPYLREPLFSTWTVLVVFRLDRLTRSIADFEAIWKFLETNGKTLVSVTEQIDFGTTAGRLMARQLVIFAEYKQEVIRAHVKNAYDAAQKAGKYPGLQFPFGYIPVKLPGKGWVLNLTRFTDRSLSRRLIGLLLASRLALSAVGLTPKASPDAAERRP